MGEKIARKTLELLMERASSQYDWNVIKYALDDYLEEGYNLLDMVSVYNTKYRKWQTENLNKN